ncbi:MAG: tRNA lysidine(34) synthetase TilS [Spirochaetaceae bacterium]|jgi:tRNA(Ile)-lysidine synthase|nr:tRNA lysidine(34) synthetase TilS [Spirochaetaceae bacterium]
MLQFEKIIQDSLKAAGVKDGDTLLAAISGGADSTALLSALSALRDNAGGFKLYALHVDHALRGDESRGDAIAAAALCENFNTPCRVITAEEGLIEKMARRIGIEAAARDFRHTALREEADRLNARFILIAHNRDDMLENTLLRILRGSGPAGLAAMPARNGRILRPLITVSRAEIIDYLLKRGLSWREDSSNKDERYLRNRVRRRLVPLLDEYFSDWRQNISALAETQALTAEFLTKEAARRINWQEIPGGKLCCDIRRFAAESQIVREEALFLAHDSITARKNSDDATDVDAPLPPSAAPRRAALRGAARMLGSMTLEASNNVITAAPCKRRSSEECTSILIDKPGIYRLKKLSIECIAGADSSYRLIVREIEQ